jgi:hypothetical protein
MSLIYMSTHTITKVTVLSSHGLCAWMLSVLDQSGAGVSCLALPQLLARVLWLRSFLVLLALDHSKTGFQVCEMLSA